MPSTQTLPVDPLLELVDPLELELLLLLLVDPLLLLVDPLLLLVDPLEDDEEVSPQNAFRDRPHATSELPQTPSTHAAARYEVPLPQLQHVGWQSEKVEQLDPILVVPLSFSGFEGQLPFTCSALEEMLLFDPLLPLLEVDDPFGSVGFDPDAIESVPPLQARRTVAMLETVSEKKAKRSPCAICSLRSIKRRRRAALRKAHTAPYIHAISVT